MTNAKEKTSSRTIEVGKRDTEKCSASFVFVDSTRTPIQGVTARITGQNISVESVTDALGHATTIDNVTKNTPLNILIKKKSGRFELKGTVTPSLDVNNYTIASPEYHTTATTKRDSKSEIEEEITIPKIELGEVMTIRRLTGELAPFVGSIQKITEEGQIQKDFPTKKTKVETSSDGKAEKVTEIEHHYRVIKSAKPRTILLNLLGSRLNTPISSHLSEEIFESMAKEFECEVAAIKAVTYTEAAGDPWDSSGLPKILFERNHFFDFTNPNKPDKNGKFSTNNPHPYAKFPDICNPKPKGYSEGGSPYERFIKAATLDLDAAIKATSWGAFQVLGEYYAECGFSSPAQLADECMKSIDGHVKLFRGFLKKPEKRAAITALKNKNWESFTAYYNGGKWRDTNPDYPEKMAAHYENFKSK